MMLFGGLVCLFLAFVGVVVFGAMRWNEPAGKLIVTGGALALVLMLSLSAYVVLVFRGI